MACSLVTSVPANQTSTSEVVDRENVCLVPCQPAVVVDGSSPHPACTNVKLGSCIAGDLVIIAIIQNLRQDVPRAS